MKVYIKALITILTSSLNITFMIIDVILFVSSRFLPDIDIPDYFYINIFLLGYLISSVNVVARKNLPVVALYLRGQVGVFKLRIRNMSKINIRDIKFVDIEIGDEPGDLTLHFELAGDTNFLKPGEERDISFSTTLENKEVPGDFFFANLLPDYASETFDFQIKYSDIPGNKYETVYTLGKNKINLKKAPRVLFK